MESQLQGVVADDKPLELLRDPHPSAQKRRAGAVFECTVMDYSKTPESLIPTGEYAAVSFDAVNTVFRDRRSFGSKPSDKTIGLFMVPAILAMEGKKRREHRNLVSAAFKSKALARCEPTIVRPICNTLIDADRHIHDQPMRSPTALPVTFDAK